MKDVSKIKNVTIAGHTHCGKTALCDLMLFKSKSVDRLGKIEDNTSVSDYTPEEQAKKGSIYATPLHCEWNNNDIFFIDTPGYGEFFGEVVGSVCAADSAMILVDGVNGIEIGATRARKLSRKVKIPRIVTINKLDCEGSDFFRTLAQLQEVYGKNTCIPMTLPVGMQDDFSEVVHVLRSKNIPEPLVDMVNEYKEKLMDTIAESDEELMEKYLEGEELSEEEISKGLHVAINAGELVPVFATCVTKDIGVTELMNGLVNLAPNPLNSPNSLFGGKEEIKAIDKSGEAIVFKSIIDPFIGQLNYFRVVNGTISPDSEVYNTSSGTKEKIGNILLMNGKKQMNADGALTPGCIGAIAKLKNTHLNDTLCVADCDKKFDEMYFPEPIMSYAITAVKSGEEDKITQGLSKIAQSDRTFTISRNKETHELLVSGMGEMHINSKIKLLKENSKLDVNLTAPKIAYRETIQIAGEGHYKHKKQSGGHGQFGEVYVKITPNEAGFEFENKVVGGSIPKNYIPAVEKGIQEAMITGPLAGCNVQNVKVSVYDGKHHPVDSSEMAFKIAARGAFKDAMSKSKPILLEPIMTVKITIPDAYMGDVNGDLNHKRGRILNMEIVEGLQVLSAEVPLAEMARYATELRSITHGRGVFSMKFERYEQLPSNLANEIMDKHKEEDV